VFALACHRQQLPGATIFANLLTEDDKTSSSSEDVVVQK